MCEHVVKTEGQCTGVIGEFSRHGVFSSFKPYFFVKDNAILFRQSSVAVLWVRINKVYVGWHSGNIYYNSIYTNIVQCIVVRFDWKKINNALKWKTNDDVDSEHWRQCVACCLLSLQACRPCSVVKKDLFVTAWSPSSDYRLIAGWKISMWPIFTTSIPSYYGSVQAYKIL